MEAIIAASGGIARPGPTVAEALRSPGPGPPGRVLICGSLYLAGEVLKEDGDRAGNDRSHLTEADRPRWTELWTGYLDFYRTRSYRQSSTTIAWRRLDGGRLVCIRFRVCAKSIA